MSGPRWSALARVAVALVIAVPFAGETNPAGGAAARELSPLAPFFARLTRSGRAEVRIERRVTAEPGSLPLSGRVSLEPPDRVRVEFDRTRERITLRADGGEWLQPELRQMVRLGASRARDALVWWDLLLGPGRDGFDERRLGASRVLLVRRESGDSVFVTVGRDALPLALRLVTADGATDEYRFSKWWFGPARGRSGFELAPPRGYEVTTLR